MRSHVFVSPTRSFVSARMHMKLAVSLCAALDKLLQLECWCSTRKENSENTRQSKTFQDAEIRCCTVQSEFHLQTRPIQNHGQAFVRCRCQFASTWFIKLQTCLLAKKWCANCSFAGPVKRLATAMQPEAMQGPGMLQMGPC